jgi:hypothetical protein
MGDGLKRARAEALKTQAANRILNALERGGTPTDRDLKAAGVCRGCYGYGYHYESEEASSNDERTTCKTCGGDGIPKRS